VIGCKRCGACCRHVALHVDAEPYQSDDHKRWADAHGHIRVVQMDGSVIVFIPNRCQNLSESNTCNIYETRMENCRLLPTPEIRQFQPPGCRYFDE
jgi:Fe-S-cluster containining protein